MHLTLSILLFTTIGVCNLVSNEQCEQIYSAANNFKESPLMAYNDADYIVDNLYLGNICAAHNLAWLREKNISVIFNMASEWQPVEYAGIRVVYFPFEDTTTLDEKETRRYINKAVSALIDINERDMPNILIHCNMGISRSATIIIRYLQIMHDMSYREALSLVKKLRPTVKPNRLFKKILIKQNL